MSESEYKVKRLRRIHFNGTMMGDSLSYLPERVEAQLASSEETKAAYLKKHGLKEEELDEGFAVALAFAINHVYSAGNPDFGDDLRRHIEIKIEYQKLGDRKNEWMPETEEQFGLVCELAETASLLGINDKVPAFQPNINSDRQTEIMDPYDVWYNKYGFLLPGTQTYGSYQ